MGNIIISHNGKPFAIEAFCSSAVLTRALRNSGLDADGCDEKGAKLSPVTPATVYQNLTTQAGQQVFESLLGQPRLVFVHFGPPCGTASRAREIPLNGPAPVPSRDEQHPEGLPDLAVTSPLDFARVQSAHALYAFTGKAAKTLTQRNIAWSIENPRSCKVSRF